MFFCFSPLLSSQFIITQMVDTAHQMILSRYHEIFRYGFILFHLQYSKGQFRNLTPYLMTRVVWLAGITQQPKLAHTLLTQNTVHCGINFLECCDFFTTKHIWRSTYFRVSEITS